MSISRLRREEEEKNIERNSSTSINTHLIKAAQLKGGSNFNIKEESDLLPHSSGRRGRGSVLVCLGPVAFSVYAAGLSSK